MGAAATEPAQQLPPSEEEPLPRMSFGDHLEELRRRLFRSLLAVGICVLAGLPFKSEITAIYIAPYRSMWIKGFEEHCLLVEERITELTAERASAGEVDRRTIDISLAEYQRQGAWLGEFGPDILAGVYPVEHASQIELQGGYMVKYNLVATRPVEDFWIFMAATFLMSLLIAGPIVLYQMWAFVAAGLYKRERKVILRYVPGAAVLLVGGASFGYFVVVPYGLYFLVQLMNFNQVQPLISVSTYFSLLFMLTMALGLVFQLPLVMLVLQKVGIVTHEALVKNWRYIILLVFVLAAVFTPPDPFTQGMMAGPMILLYLLGLLLTGRSAKRMARQAAGEQA